MPPAGRTFGAELADFLAFVRRPRLGPRPRRALPPHWRYWILGGAAPRHLLAWLLALWALNLLVLGPLAVSVASGPGVERKVSAAMLSWFLVVAWAPVIEELLFRFGLRRPWAGIWIGPLALACLLSGPGLPQGLSLAAGVALVLWTAGRRPWRWRPWRRRYVTVFPYVFHAATLAFALLHLANYRIEALTPWLLPLLVLPQWATGLVLGWLRVRYGLGAAIALHAAFNAGPMAVLWLGGNYLN